MSKKSMLVGCSAMMPDNKIYPCVTGCGNESLNAPDGYVYYHDKLMTLDAFNKLTGQHLVIEGSDPFISVH